MRRLLTARAMTRASDETGMVLVIALIVIMIAGLLAGAVVAGAIHTNDSTNRDGNLKAAVGAADAGLEVATYRLNMLAPSDPNTCVTNAVVSPTNGRCPQDGPEGIGNGATFSFWPSPVLTSTSTCAGLAIVNGQSTVSQRCITSIGTANGVSARVQARVSAFTTTPAFQFPMLGLNFVSLSNNDTVTGPTPTVATNGLLTVKQNATVTGCELGSGDSSPPNNSGSVGTPNTCTQASSAFYLAPVNTSGTYPTSSPADADQQIINGLNTSCVGVPLCDPSSGGVTFDLTSRNLNLPNGSSLTLSGGTYNFCNFTTGTNATIAIAAGAKVAIYIDSPYDTGSGCAAGTGTLTLAQGTQWLNYSLDPTNQQIWVYGCGGTAPSNCTNTVTLSNNSNTYMSLYAPFSAVSISGSNNTVFDGAINALSITIKNVTTFKYDGKVAGITLQTSGHYYRTAWEQCPATPTTPSDPTSGC